MGLAVELRALPALEKKLLSNSLVFENTDLSRLPVGKLEELTGW